MGNKSARTAENKVLNVVRAVSALLVVLGHVRLLFFEDYATAEQGPITAVLYALTSLGSQAVIVFFVLSGYWVGLSAMSRMKTGTFSWSSYASSRLTRLWLVLLPALVLTAVVDQIGRRLFPDSDVYIQGAKYVGIPADASYSTLTFIGNLAFVQSIHVPYFGTNGPLWSLAFEFWYYLLFPALLIAFRRSATWKARVAAVTILIAGAAISGTEVLLLFPAWLLGALVAANRNRISAMLEAMRPSQLLGARSSAVFLTVGTMIFSHETTLPLRLGAWLTAIAAALLVLVFVRDVEFRGAAGRALSTVSYTAKFSYSFYAIHMPLVVFLAALIVPLHEGRWPMDLPHMAMAAAVILAIGFASYLFGELTEQKTEATRSLIARARRAATPDRYKAPKY
ncbi:acyltransferase family protein [Arthrobacter agilis]|uniref:acyltransferase family protein n=1 Tax=Arthrobacter agilis TaxID=37921 RepID=UPI002786C8A6|nr:acyltransferase [Arthrobacter agilis]MDQ0734056.1 peptidoglycan/LPS O-acetylase OafA/YrhL [Arthrobacter agilis]